MSLRDTLHISGKSKRPQSSEEAGNLFNFTKEAGCCNLPFRRAGGLESWRGELSSGAKCYLLLGVPPDLRIPENMKSILTERSQAQFQI